MKKLLSIFLLATFFAYANHLPNKDLTFTLEEKQPANFKYFSFGGCGVFLPISPEIALGCRKLNSHHVWDVQAGTSVILPYFWGQASYLYHFLPNQGTYSTPYLGFGLTLAHIGKSSKLGLNRKLPPVCPNFPVTIGYQWGKDHQNQFLQLQVTPFAITTLSYGVGF
jgi:hypothetical protein